MASMHGTQLQRTKPVEPRLTIALKSIAIACGICAVLLTAACAPVQQTSSSSPDPEASAAAEVAADEAAENVANPEESDVEAVEAVEDEVADVGATNTGELTARDQDFAVDPERTTDWNYDGNGKKTVYLTIDDGPSKNTEKVLDILDQYGCKATFFVVGLDSAYYPMIKEAYDRGHTIGLHSDTHDYATVYASTDAYFEDLDAIGQIVKDQIGYVPCFIRFPGGSSNMVSADYCTGIMTALVDEVQERGYQYYDWNMSVGDGSEHTTDEIVGYGTEPTDLTNIVLLCHDSATKQSTVEALPRIIEHYQELGYSFEAIDRSSFVPHHGVGN